MPFMGFEDYHILPLAVWIPFDFRKVHFHKIKDREMMDYPMI
jgi:hypothetical protein